MRNPRVYGDPPYSVAVVHGGPGAGGEMAPVAPRLSANRGVLEPIRTAGTLERQVEELAKLEDTATLPVTLIGYSWGAWLSFMLAARRPHLVSSGPFDTKYVSKLHKTRLTRLGEAEGIEFETISRALNNGANPEKDALLNRLEGAAERPCLDSLQPTLLPKKWERCAFSVAGRKMREEIGHS